MDHSAESPIPDVSVVIPALNAANVLPLQLAALSRQTTDLTMEVVVADNGSTDGTATVAEAFARALPVRVVDASERKGVNHARNAGVAATRSGIVLLCDSDDLVADNWVTEMALALAQFDAVGGCYSSWRPSCNDRRPVICPEHLHTQSFLPYPLGANCGFRRSVWNELAGFDESYDSGGGDEVEFFWRLQLAGFSFGAAPAATISYRVADGTKSQLKKTYRVRREGMRLARDFQSYGARRASQSHIIRASLAVCWHAPKALRSRDARTSWLTMAAKRAGQIVGYYRYH